MQIITHIQKLNEALSESRKIGVSIGFIPTMGALHKGHLSLIEASVKSNDISIASIFVNPTQFNDKNDLEKYPRTLKVDYNLLESANCDIVFAPDKDEMYPEKDSRQFLFGYIGETMEGKMRPGHFNGVAQIVTKLFDIVMPGRAYFGKKDFQQLAVIKKLVNDYHYPIEIIACPIIREEDGLAMSSRNVLLKLEERKEASRIYQSLLQVKNEILTHNIADLKKMVEENINQTNYLKLDYFQIVNTNTLIPVSEITDKEPVTACIAVYAGKIRLIDNLDLIS